MKAGLVRLTKQSLLDHITEEDIFKRYMGIDEVDENASYTNERLRSDNSPGCKFFRRSTDGRLLFNDWTWKTFDCFDYVQQLYGIKFSQALYKIACDFRLIEDQFLNLPEVKKVQSPVKKKKLVLKIKRRNPLPYELRFWSIGELEVDQETLEENKIYTISSFWEFRGEESKHYPNQKLVFAYNFGDGKFQIYRPEYSRDRRRFINSPDILFGDLDLLNPNEYYVVITKSKKDAFYLRLLGVNVCFVIAERISPNEQLMDALSSYPLKFTLFDNDITGKKLSLIYKKSGFIPLLYSKSDGKDTATVLKNYDKYFLLDLIEELKSQYLYEEADNDGISESSY